MATRQNTTENRTTVPYIDLQAQYRYGKLLKDSSYKLPTYFPDCECVWHCYVIECQDRNRGGHVLQEAGIETGLHYPLPIHLQKAYAFLGYRRGDLPVTKAFCDRCLSLPMYAELTDEQISAVVSALRKIAA